MSDNKEQEEEFEGRPFVLAWVEKSTLDKLRNQELVFSEKVDGLDADTVAEGEKFETTGGAGGIPEAADTSITF